MIFFLSIKNEQDKWLKELADSVNSVGNEKCTDSSLIPLNKLPAPLKGISLTGHIYSSTVKEPSYYTEHKHEEYGTLKYVLRKLSGIPFAVLYGVVLVWIISDIILSKPGGRLKFNLITEENIPRNICASAFGQENNSTYVNQSENYNYSGEFLDKGNFYKKKTLNISEEYTPIHETKWGRNVTLYSTEGYPLNSKSMYFTDKRKGSIFFPK